MPDFARKNQPPKTTPRPSIHAARSHIVFYYFLSENQPKKCRRRGEGRARGSGENGWD